MASEGSGAPAGPALVAVLVIIAIALVAYIASKSGPAAQSPTATSGTPYYENVSAWQVYRDSSADLSIAYPIDFAVDTSAASSTDWRLNAGSTPGVLTFTLTLPKALQPQTNFAEARLTLGYSSDARAVRECLTPDPSGSATEAAPIVISGIAFTIFHASGAGAGNLYETTSYRTIRANTCYAIEYTIHSTQIANYPAEYGLTPFDKAAVAALLDRIVGTLQLSANEIGSVY